MLVVVVVVMVVMMMMVVGVWRGDGGGVGVGGHPLSLRRKKNGDPNQLRRTDATAAVSAAGRFRNISASVDLVCDVLEMDEWRRDYSLRAASVVGCACSG